MNLLGKAEALGQNPYLALLTYCSTPIDNSLPSPAQLPNQGDYPTQLPISEWLQCSQALATILDKNVKKNARYMFNFRILPSKARFTQDTPPPPKKTMLKCGPNIFAAY